LREYIILVFSHLLLQLFWPFNLQRVFLQKSNHLKAYWDWTSINRKKRRAPPAHHTPMFPAFRSDIAVCGFTIITFCLTN